MPPRTSRARAMRVIRPVAGACMGTDTKPPGSAIGSLRTTSWPSRTIGRAGAPVCCESGMIISSAKGRRRMGRCSVSDLYSGGCTPCENVLSRPNRVNMLMGTNKGFAGAPHVPQGRARSFWPSGRVTRDYYISLNLAARFTSLSTPFSFGSQGSPGRMHRAAQRSAAFTMSL